MTESGAELLDPLVEEPLFSGEKKRRLTDKAHHKPSG